MAGAYSADRRERVLRTCARPSRARIAALFQVAESTVYRWRQTWRAEGRRVAKPHGGGPAPRLDAEALEKLAAIVAKANDLSLAEYAAKRRERTGVAASGPTVCRALRKLGLRREKSLRVQKQDRPRSSAPPPSAAGEALRLGDRGVDHHRLQRILGYAGREPRVPDPGTAQRR
jgi:transposase